MGAWGWRLACIISPVLAFGLRWRICTLVQWLQSPILALQDPHDVVAAASAGVSRRHATTSRRRRWVWAPAREETVPPVGQRRVALCIVGEARTFGMPLVHSWFKKHAVDSLPADAFVVFKEQQRFKTLFLHPADRCDLNTSLAALRTLEPINVTILGPDQRVGRSKSCGPRDEIAVGEIQVSQIEECFSMVELHEQRRGQKYESWIVARPDLLLFDTLTRKALERPMHIATKPDFLFGGPRETLRQHFQNMRAGPVAWLRTPCKRSEEALEQAPFGARYHVRAGLVRGTNKQFGTVLGSWSAQPYCASREELAMLDCKGLSLQPHPTERHTFLKPCDRATANSLRRTAELSQHASQCERTCSKDPSCTMWTVLPTGKLNQSRDTCQLSSKPVAPPPCECTPEEGGAANSVSGFKYEEFMLDVRLVGKLFHKFRVEWGDLVVCLTTCLVHEGCTAWSFDVHFECQLYSGQWPQRQYASGALSGYVHWHYFGQV